MPVVKFLDGSKKRLRGLVGADLRKAYLIGAYFKYANLWNTNLQDADLRYANLHGANLQDANLRDARLLEANLSHANLRGANLMGADLTRADLTGADLTGASLRGSNLQDAKLQHAIGLVKIIGVMPGNKYWKRLNADLTYRDYQFKLGLNTLKQGEVFVEDERILHPTGFHFGSRSWCAVRYSHCPREALIQIPEDAKINEPWATDGGASADKIIILQIF